MKTSADPSDPPPMFDVSLMLEHGMRPRPVLIMWMVRHGIAHTKSLRKAFNSSRPAMHAEYKLLEEKGLIIRYPTSLPSSKCQHILALTDDGEAMLDLLTRDYNPVRV